MSGSRPRLGLGLVLGLELSRHIAAPSFSLPKRSYLSTRCLLPLFCKPNKYYFEHNTRMQRWSICLWQHKVRNFMHYSVVFGPMTSTQQLNKLAVKKLESKEEINQIGQCKEKILFNSVLEKEKMNSSWLKKKILADKDKRKKTQSDPYRDFPVALKYIINMDEYKAEQEPSSLESEISRSETIVQLPYTVRNDNVCVNLQRDGNMCQGDTPTQKEAEAESNGPETVKLPNGSLETNSKPPRNWMTDYDFYADTEEEMVGSAECNDEQSWEMNYGTSDPTIPVSEVPCGGCGALLHCQDTAIPGYLPTELFKNKSNSNLRTMKCQRCHFLLHYNTALSVNVAPDEYPLILSQIKNKKALAILMVDLMDFPCSIWPNILDIIGTKRPVVIVGNKVDLLPQDCPGFLRRVEEVVVQTLTETGLDAANIKHVALVSAKTGYGVDELITQLHNSWQYQGDVFLIGCTNVGKSTLFNALLQSDLCKVKAVDLLQRATTSPWPGTTLNLLKFPIMRPEGWRLFVRTRRLITERRLLREEQRLRQHQAKKTRTAATLIGHIGLSFRPPVHEVADPFAVNTTGQTWGKLMGLNPYDKDFLMSKWCYDTPGTVQPAQVINLLTTDELMLTLPKKLLHPRSFSIVPGNTLFIAGLGRLDYVAGSKSIRFTVFASQGLPITVCRTADAEELYSVLLGSEYLAVPRGGRGRLERWPDLVAAAEDVRLTGEDWRKSCADVVLSSAGWVAITPGQGMEVQLRAWTPGGRGIFVRPPLLPFSVNHRGERIRRSPAYKKGTGIYTR